jgi:hypothetical protein
MAPCQRREAQPLKAGHVRGNSNRHQTVPRHGAAVQWDSGVTGPIEAVQSTPHARKAVEELAKAS